MNERPVTQLAKVVHALECYDLERYVSLLVYAVSSVVSLRCEEPPIRVKACLHKNEVVHIVVVADDRLGVVLYC